MYQLETLTIGLHSATWDRDVYGNSFDTQVMPRITLPNLGQFRIRGIPALLSCKRFFLRSLPPSLRNSISDSSISSSSRLLAQSMRILETLRPQA